MSKIVKGGPFGLFENPVCCKISKKIEGGPFGDIKKLSKKKRKMIYLNSLIVTKNVEGGLWAFSTSLQLQNIREQNIPFRDKKNFEKKSHSAEKN